MKRKNIMLIKTILNRCYPLKRFVYENAEFSKGVNNAIEVQILPRKNSQPYCSGCGKKKPTYDRLPQRKFEFIPIWGFKVFFLYARRRVECDTCGVVAELLPWVDGKHQLTLPYMQFLATWARRLSWKEVAETFKTSWDKVYGSVKWIVDWGLKNRKLKNIRSIGVDEIQYSKGHKYLTLVYQIDEGLIRLLWVGKDRTVEAFEGFFSLLGKELTAKIEFVCSDMWKPYLKVIKEKCSQALHVLDRFHIVKKMNEALDKIRAEEARKLEREGYEPVLKKSRWCILKKPGNLTGFQKGRLKEILQYNLKTIRAYFLKEDFQHFWEYESPTWAGKFLDGWCEAVMRSRLEQMKKIARMIKKHRSLILNWFEAKGQLSQGIVEGLNNKAKLTMRKSYGFRNPDVLEMALLQALGKLPEPKLTHEFY